MILGALLIRSWLIVACSGVATASCLDPGEPVLQTQADSLLRARCNETRSQAPELSSPAAFQLHTHAHSNHGSSNRPASMQFHGSQARRYGVRGIVWSEHLTVFNQSDSVILRWQNATVDPESVHVKGLTGDVTRLGAQRSPTGSFSAALSPAELLISVSGGTSAAPARLTYSTQHVWIDGVARWPESLRFNRPLSSGVEIDLQYRFCGASSGPVHVVVRLSWHVDAGGNERQHAVHYVLNPQGGPSSRSLESASVVRVERPVATEGRIILDPYDDAAALLPDGDDNTIVDVSWYVESTGTSDGCVGIRRLVIRSRSPGVFQNWRQSLRFAERYTQQALAYGFIGFEGWVPAPPIVNAGLVEGGRAGAHVNVLFPDNEVPSLPDFLRLGGWDLSITAHRSCGVVTVNHPFGYEILTQDSTSRLARRDRIIDLLVSQGAFGADMIEIGLPARGDALDVHLLLWDRLSAAGLRMCGVGTSDTHGWRWDNPGQGTYTENRNPYVTWVWYRGVTQRDLVEALRSCRSYFGNPFLFQGSIDFASSEPSARMGETIRVSQDSVLITPAIEGSEGSDVWLVQGFVSGSSGPLEKRQTRLASHDSAVWVSSTRSSFVRLEVRTQEGTPMAFSNPIWLLR